MCYTRLMLENKIIISRITVKRVDMDFIIISKAPSRNCEHKKVLLHFVSFHIYDIGKLSHCVYILNVKMICNAVNDYSPNIKHNVSVINKRLQCTNNEVLSRAFRDTMPLTRCDRSTWLWINARQYMCVRGRARAHISRDQFHFMILI